MTYATGGTIEAADYNGFVANTVDANVNDIWGVGSGSKGWGQTPLATVSQGATVTATVWASLVNTIATMSQHTGVSITSRTAPVAGNIIAVLSNVNTDLSNLNTGRGNAVASGSEITSWSGTTSKTSATGSGGNSWTITFTHTISWGSANAARYWFNAGGIVRLRVSKTSTGTQADPEWNDIGGQLMNEIRIVGRTGGSQNIAGTVYTGVNKTVGTGTPSIHASTTGFFNLTTVDTNLYRQNGDTSPYTSQYINVAAKTAASGTQMVITTTWFDNGAASPPAAPSNITGGTATNSPFSSFGTAPATVVTLVPPDATYISDTWGTPTIAAAVA